MSPARQKIFNDAMLCMHLDAMDYREEQMNAATVSKTKGRYDRELRLYASAQANAISFASK